MILLSSLFKFIVATVPVLLIAFFIYKKDKNKEPKGLLISLFLAGIGSCFLTLAISEILSIFVPYVGEDYETLNLLQLVIYVFVGVALVEEFSKWFMAYMISYKHKEFNEIYDAIVFCGFVALGFAFFENILYVFEGGIGVGIMRALLAVPGHTCDGIFMGYYLGLAKQSEHNGRVDLKKKYVLLSIFVPTILHGIYDYCLMSGLLIFLLVFITFIVLIYVFSLKKIKRMASINKKIFYNDKFCANCGRVVDSDFCPVCGRKHN